MYSIITDTEYIPCGFPVLCGDAHTNIHTHTYTHTSYGIYLTAMHTKLSSFVKGNDGHRSS